MKHVRFFVGATIAAMTFLACNKEDAKPVDGPMKSVEIDLANILTSRSAGTAIADGTPVTLKDCQIFFTDGTALYKGQNADATDAVQFFSGSAVPTAPVKYHYLPAAVNKVVVVGNMGAAITPANLAAIEKDLMIAGEQDSGNLRLYGESGLTATNTVDEHTILYKATVNLVPRVARLEVSGFECEFSTTPKYSKIALNKIALNNWNAKTKYMATTVSDLMNQTITDGTVFGWINPLTGVWYADPITGVELTPAAPSDNTKTFVYHTFPATVPQLVLTCMNDGAPAYLVTQKLKNATGGAEITAFEPGKIYKLAFKFKDTDFNQPVKCIDITVTVAKWVVVPVVPVF